MQFLVEYGLFLAKTATIAVAVLIAGGALVTVSLRQRKSSDQQSLEVTHLNKQFDEMEQTLSGALLSPRQLKQKRKSQKKAERDKVKAERKAEKVKPAGDGETTVGDGDATVADGNATVASGNATVADGKTTVASGNATVANGKTTVADGDATVANGKVTVANGKTTVANGADADTTDNKRIFVLDFDGDIRATEVASLRHEVSAVLTMAGAGDEVVVRLESNGGVVHGYGLAASQLQRIRERNIPLTVAVDKVAASGGYMMACVADKIIAAPFAVVGSIGVLAQLPNLNRLLKKHEIDFEQLHAGEYKRTLTLFGENTDKAREKMQQEIEETHDLFKDFVKAQRPALDMDKVATGEHWLGSRALELGLVDHLQTSDDYLMAARADAQLILLNYTHRKKLLDRLASMMQSKSAEMFDRPMLR